MDGRILPVQTPFPRSTRTDRGLRGRRPRGPSLHGCCRSNEASPRPSSDVKLAFPASTEYQGDRGCVAAHLFEPVDRCLCIGELSFERPRGARGHDHSGVQERRDEQGAAASDERAVEVETSDTLDYGCSALECQAVTRRAFQAEKDGPGRWRAGCEGRSTTSREEPAEGAAATWDRQPQSMLCKCGIERGPPGFRFRTNT